MELRRQWGSRASLNFLLFFEAQAVLCGIVYPCRLRSWPTTRLMTARPE